MVCRVKFYHNENDVDYLLISVLTEPGGLVVLGAVDVGAVVEGAIPSTDGTSSSLVLEMPVEAGEGSVLLALVLKKEGTLFDSKFFQVSEKEKRRLITRWFTVMLMLLVTKAVTFSCL